MKLPGLRRSAAMWVAAALTVLAAVAVPVAQAQAPAAKPFDVLQLNLCNSGFADCYSAGKAVNSAIALIQQRQPDVVTLNEICAQDITRMTRETGYLWEFTPVGDKSTGGPYTCKDWRGDYGIAILTHPDLGAAGEPVERQYAAQDGSNEQRVLLCVPYSKVSACTTHLSAADGRIAAEQCRELSGVAAALGAESVIGGDLNLVSGGNPDVQGCVPDGWYRKDDGSVQHVLAMDVFRFENAETIPVDGTDHPGLLVKTTR
ncbi:endonuclease/exonuclease/phosphatase family protein [Saccharopolyspora spinosa]|uniref:Endonuclease/Exonuclease/phosphatase family protein n=1 Tax=Saccharopolyspora spinosa TaxID=60894 RepID=A0A2N3XRY5_SACSN|nr:endonuclease/exonuclease/phosphatase family protein [Saccharopolyspora spinosa]PKW13392.1 Endonuclease/Exonuclease/phosphatase family protein [Saccharopolyspora spinosa]